MRNLPKSGKATKCYKYASACNNSTSVVIFQLSRDEAFHVFIHFCAVYKIGPLSILQNDNLYKCFGTKIISNRNNSANTLRANGSAIDSDESTRMKSKTFAKLLFDGSYANKVIEIDLNVVLMEIS